MDQNTANISTYTKENSSVPFRESQGTRALFWKLLNKGQKSIPYSAPTTWTIPLSNQTVDEGKGNIDLKKKKLKETYPSIRNWPYLDPDLNKQSK